ncbi:TadE/TadG family type IV pilus assembly protein [Asticcacaulis endophyticus]|uniref:Pilus biosynthesis protein TadE n=1 Tax=Asticcacaulis endophyticus TaxID=1395890 RepID=A0A918PS73_9CAUL|nr:TadE/TadG family type IV pilus assembly protein [Asticcacaulis endophyticus]GGZ20609.1 pilus biosynthesis protein TadE [Asticcacaulis endophyticus]
MFNAVRRYRTWLTAARRRASAGLRDRKGSAAVEFALIAGPLILLIFGCLELALFIIVSVLLDNATQAAAREIRMGILTGENSDATSFRQQICDNMGWVAATCMNDLQIDVETFDNFTGVDLTPPIVEGEFEEANFSYDLGGSSSIQLVSAYYSYSLITPILSSGMATLSNGDAVLTTQVIFRNEPF